MAYSGESDHSWAIDPGFLDRQLYSPEDLLNRWLHCIDSKKLLRCFCGMIDSFEIDIKVRE